MWGHRSDNLDSPIKSPWSHHYHQQKHTHTHTLSCFWLENCNVIIGKQSTYCTCFSFRWSTANKIIGPLWLAVEKQNHHFFVCVTMCFYSFLFDMFIISFKFVHSSSQKLLLKKKVCFKKRMGLGFYVEVSGYETHKANICFVENNFSPAFKFCSNRLE